MKKSSVNLGLFLKQQRLSRQLSRAALSERLSVSEKTLQRIELGQVEVKAGQLLTLMNFFGVTPAEIVDLAAMPLSTVAVGNQIEQARAQNDAASLQQLSDKLRQAYRQQQIPWLRCAVIVCECLQAKMMMHDEQARRLAARLCAYYLRCETITCFDFRLLTFIVGEAPYEMAHAFFVGGQVKRQQSRHQCAQIIAEYFVGLLDSALMTKDSAVVLKVCQLLQQQKLTEPNHYFSMYQKLAQIMGTWLNGEVNTAVRNKQAFISALKRLYPSAVAAQNVALIQREWNMLQQVTEITPTMRW